MKGEIYGWEGVVGDQKSLVEKPRRGDVDILGVGVGGGGEGGKGEVVFG